MREPRPHTERPRPGTPALSRRALVAGTARAAALVAGASLLATAGAAGCSAQDAADAITGAESPATSSTFAFDTYCTFTVYGDDAAPALLARECARYDALLDLSEPDSDLARINAAGGAPVEVDPDTADVIAQALAFCARAQGRFDITIGAVSTLWDFTEGVRPSDEAIVEALAHVGWQNVQVDDTDPQHPTVALGDPAAKLDLGGIAKGYVADRLCETLRTQTDAVAAAISLGSNIAYFGEKPGGGAWETGIRDPNDPGGSTVVDVVETGACSLVTSGLYERTFELDGVTYWHILDPATGMPVATDTASVTVCCPSSTQADALSTALFVAGSAQGIEMVDAWEDTGAYFLLIEGGTVESERWGALTGRG